MSTKKLIHTLTTYDSGSKRKKLSEIGVQKIVKILNISGNEVNQAEKLQ